jgi:hypothetical protein
VERFITTRQTEGMNILTLRKILVTLNQIFSYAVRHRLIEYNLFRDAEKPRDPGKNQEGHHHPATGPDSSLPLEYTKPEVSHVVHAGRYQWGAARGASGPEVV